MKKEIILDIKTGKKTSVDFTAEELANFEAQKQSYEAELLAAEQAQAEKQANLESAKAKLTALGLDEAEVQAILGL